MKSTFQLHSCLQPCTILVTGTGEAHEGFSFLVCRVLLIFCLAAFFIGSAILQMDSSLQPSRISSSRWPMDARGVMATCLRHFPHSSAPDFGATSIRTGQHNCTGCLDPENFKEFTLVEKRDRSRPSSGLLSRVQTPTRLLLYWAFQIPIGQHISCRGQDAAGEEVIKPCTPTTLDSDLGYFELVIKV
ncbi:hypothetical protein GUJ93_ZPchr0010g9576 [Zizania palustris]|uniref:Flavoprotein pyridine nucleotide cytochrome reductase-like FAD-binding domain-containing protein n=1 Tax=Zizania palustris TaxID=103762 RepID=A0A8J5WB43_ZIZPA|nr:hypothetical protein GUJ93_ZPchr0010g9576 [Zizania palustris]